jgi:hypothetical protein
LRNEEFGVERKTLREDQAGLRLSLRRFLVFTEFNDLKEISDGFNGVEGSMLASAEIERPTSRATSPAPAMPLD